MWKIIGSFFTTNQIGLLILKWGSILATVLVILLGAKQAGKNAEVVERLEQQAKIDRESTRIRNRVDTDPDYRQKIRDKFDAQ